MNKQQRKYYCQMMKSMSHLLFCRVSPRLFVTTSNVQILIKQFDIFQHLLVAFDHSISAKSGRVVGLYFPSGISCPVLIDFISEIILVYTCHGIVLTCIIMVEHTEHIIVVRTLVSTGIGV